jgi:hypothetical protein
VKKIGNKQKKVFKIFEKESDTVHQNLSKNAITKKTYSLESST